VSDAASIDELSALFLFLADTDLVGYSPRYEQLARSVATDRDVLAWILSAASPNMRRGRIPVLFLAATRDAALADPASELAAVYDGTADIDPLVALHQLLDTHGETIATSMRTRSVQTNEVGRSAAIVPAMVVAAAGHRRIALVEIGPSAGLNLFCDRYRITYVAGGAVAVAAGPPDSPVHLHCDLRGTGIPPVQPVPDIVVRTGVDLAPVDVRDPIQRRWLSACVWPGQPRRSALLTTACNLVAGDPPVLVTANAVDAIAPLVAGLDNDLYPVVVSTWAMAYLSAAERTDLVGRLDAAGRDHALVTMEEPRFTPWLDGDPSGHQAPGDGTPTVLGVRWTTGATVTARQLADVHPHGAWMRWLGD
jgi:hypothetical protein